MQFNLSVKYCWRTFIRNLLREKFEDTKGVIRSLNQRTDNPMDKRKKTPVRVTVMDMEIVLDISMHK